MKQNLSDSGDLMKRRSVLVVCSLNGGLQLGVHCYVLHILNIHNVNCDSTYKQFFIHYCANFGSTDNITWLDEVLISTVL